MKRDQVLSQDYRLMRNFRTRSLISFRATTQRYPTLLAIYLLYYIYKTETKIKYKFNFFQLSAAQLFLKWLKINSS